LKFSFIKLFGISLALLLSLQLQTSYADTEPVLITWSDRMNSIIFDGKWTFLTEWKPTSLNSMEGSIKIRSAHQGDYIYIFVDVLSDFSLDKGSDNAVICFDYNNTKSSLPDENDYCFIAILDREVGFTLRGGSFLATTSYFEKIPNHPDYIAIGGVSDENDRYSKTPHPSYEFKIPTDLIGRSSTYGFYVETFDAKTANSLTWPANIFKKSPLHIPSPEVWGDMISPDKSLPEFPLPHLLLAILFISMIIMSRKLNYGRLRINIH